MKQLARITALTFLLSALVLAFITACGSGHGTGGGTNPPGSGFTFIWSPAHLATLHAAGSKAIAGASSPFTVSAATVTGTGNLQGICSAIAPSSGRVATVLFNLGRWSSGSCDDGATPDSDIGVPLPAAGQIGNLKVDAVGNGSASNSGLVEVVIISAGGTRTITSLTCSLGQSAVEARVHCEDLTAGHFIAVNPGDQLITRFLYNAGDDYRGIRVNLDYGAPTL